MTKKLFSQFKRNVPIYNRLVQVNRPLMTVSRVQYTTNKKDEEIKKEEPAMEGEEISVELLKKQMKEKDSELIDLQDKYLRLLADMENLRTRTKREIKDASQFGIQKFAKEIIQIADLLEMAIESVPSNELNNEEQKHLSDLHKGVTLTLSEMIGTFKKHGLEQMNPIKEKFNANYHDALYEIVAEDKESGTILAVQKKGYTLNDRLIRPASVGVSKK